MNYPCGIIKDLLPLYYDGVCSPESSQAVNQNMSREEIERRIRICTEII